VNPALAALFGNEYVVFAGWTLMVVLWETTIVAAVYAAWRLVRGRARAEAEYRVGLAALTVAIALAAIVPLALASWPVPAPSAAPRPAAAATPHKRVAPASTTGDGELRRNLRTAGVTPDRLAALAALAWVLGVSLLTLRFAGGWYVAGGLVGRARPIEDENLSRAAATAAARAGVRRPFALLESPDVEAPVVLRWRRPVLLVPHAAVPRLGPEQMTALLVHEFAHVRRRDYLVNLGQSIVELLLFFSPSVLWMSRRVREAREFCCDDAAVAECGNRVTYVEALTTLAALGTINAARSVQGISGPRLITRVRRLLKEEPMPRFSPLRVAALAAVVIGLFVSGLQLSAASAARAPRRGAALAQGRVPHGYATNQEGAGLVVKGLRAGEDGTFESARLQNVSTERAVGVRFVAAIERRESGIPGPVRLFVSDEIPISIAPNETAEVTGDVLTSKQIDDVARESPGARLQAFFALQSVRFANGSEWHTTPNPSAQSGAEAAGIPRIVYPRALIERDAAKAPVAGGDCVDDRGRKTSPGGMVPILNEPGHVMRCTDGRWIETLGR
jgi:beta-lactamase regulating signal transducer with metallopeptidase domain